MYICLDLGGTHLRGTWLDEQGRHGPVLVLPRKKTLEGTKEVLSELIIRLKNSCPGQVKKIGLATAGPFDRQGKVYLSPTNMPELSGFKVGSFIQEQFALDLILENDAQAAALGEVWQGGLKGENQAIVLTLGTGVGSGVIFDGRIWRAAHDTGPELGHIYLGEGPIERCGCGQFGCAETWLNKKALLDLFARHDLVLNDPKEIWPYIRNEHTGAIKALQEYGHRLGLFLTQLMVIFNIKAIGISGGISSLGSYFLSETWTMLKLRLQKRPWLWPEKIVASVAPQMSALWGMARLIALAMRAD